MWDYKKKTLCLVYVQEVEMQSRKIGNKGIRRRFILELHNTRIVVNQFHSSGITTVENPCDTVYLGSEHAIRIKKTEKWNKRGKRTQHNTRTHSG